MRDHGGDLDAAISRYGGRREGWLDLSTGINRVPYPLPPLDLWAWTTLPEEADVRALCTAAADAYGTPARVVALAGAQAAIQLVPRLMAPGCARIVSPTYNEHAHALAAQGWRVEPVAGLAALAGADLAVVVNPNNPDGRRHDPDDLRRLARQVGCLVVDESFADPEPRLSLAPWADEPRTIVLRSFGKFYGLAGLRLGFALAGAEIAARIGALAGPWAVSGPAVAIGTAALRDGAWRAATARRLEGDAARLDALAHSSGWRPAGGTSLFRLYETDDAEGEKERLARRAIWSRTFPWSKTWIRLGIPGGEPEWDRFGQALKP